ncbi:MAG TPA: hypothetical protein VFE84_09930, partial [Patescibacteria group bacterium]|nr:hypothetical protein [Patescibacteria group bacterium]
GDRLHFGEVEVEVLNPSSVIEPGRPDNERSVVLEARLGGRSIVLAGDAGAATEAELTTLAGRADLLKVGHHGSRSSSTGAFLATIHPKVAAISCGRNNRFGHPHPEVVGRLRALGARICRTDQDGAFSVELLAKPAPATRLDEACALAARRPAIRTPPETVDAE